MRSSASIAHNELEFERLSNTRRVVLTAVVQKMIANDEIPPVGANEDEITV